jgi:phage-related protein (TIGR01555 family)
MSLANRVLDTVQRLDAWQNVITGLGTVRDKLSAQEQVLAAPLTDQQLESLYTDDDIAAKIVAALPSEALRAGFRIHISADEIEDATTVSRSIDDALKALGAGKALRQAWIWGRLYGYGCVFVGADDGQDVSEPLDLERVASCRFLTVLRRTQLVAESYYTDIRSPKFGQVERFRVIVPPQTRMQQGTVTGADGKPVAPLRTGSSRYGDLIVHESRLLTFRGVTSARYQVLSGTFWDDSVLQRPYQALKQSASAWMSTAHLMTDASQGVFKVANLIQMLAANGEALLRKRLQMMDIARSSARAVLLDAEKESFERVATTFTGIPDLLDRFMMRIAAAASMPATVLWGRSPAGMNATGESDVRGWYDRVASERLEELVPAIEQLTRIIMATDDGPTNGEVIDGWHVEFPPLWQETKAEKATAFKTTSDALVALTTAQIILPEEAALALAHSGEFGELDVESREHALKLELERMRAEPQPDDLLPAGGDGALPGLPGGGDAAADSALNGAQVASLLDIVRAVAAGEIPRETAVAIIMRAFSVDERQADQMLSTVGRGFVPTPKQAPPSLHAAPPPPPPQGAE